MIVFDINNKSEILQNHEGVCNYSYFNNAFNRHDTFVLKNIDTK